jgi:hypothetical protein
VVEKMSLDEVEKIILDVVEEVNLGMTEAGGVRIFKVLWAGNFLKFPARIIQDAWVVRGS